MKRGAVGCFAAVVGLGCLAVFGFCFLSCMGLLVGSGGSDTRYPSPRPRARETASQEPPPLEIASDATETESIEPSPVDETPEPADVGPKRPTPPKLSRSVTVPILELERIRHIETHLTELLDDAKRLARMRAETDVPPELPGLLDSAEAALKSDWKAAQPDVARLPDSVRAPYAFAVGVWDEPLVDQALVEESVANVLAHIGKVSRQEPPKPKHDPAPRAEMIVKTQELVKLGLNFPKTADFNFFTDSREDLENGIFVISEAVEARNAFNVPDDVHYTARWVRVDEDDWQLSYFEMGGEVAVDNDLESDTQKRKAREAREADERFKDWKTRRVASREATEAAAKALDGWRVWMRDSREWTSKAGSKQRAKVVGVFAVKDVEMIRLEHRDGSDMQFELGLLAEEDQRVAREWREQQRLAK